MALIGNNLCLACVLKEIWITKAALLRPGNYFMRLTSCGAVLFAAALAEPGGGADAAGLGPGLSDTRRVQRLCPARGTAGGMTPEQRVDVIMSRITPLLGTPIIRPSDVVVYIPPAKSRYNRYPVIYALGRRIVTVDPETVKSSGPESNTFGKRRPPGRKSFSRCCRVSTGGPPICRSRKSRLIRRCG